MLDGIDVVLHGIVSDLQLEMLAEAVQAMELFKYYDTVSQVSLYISGAGQQEPILIKDTVFAIVDQGLDELLGGFEILTLDADISCKTIILRGLYYMENSQESEFIANTIDNAESIKDAFITLLEHFTGSTADFFFPYLASEENSYITKLYELHKVKSDLAVEDIKVVNESAVDRCKVFLAKYPQTLLHEAIFIERFTPGVSSKILFNFYQPQLSQLYPLALNQLAIEIIGLMALSNALTKNFNAEVKKKLNAIIPDQFEAAKMVVLIDDITMELGLYAS